PDEGMWEVRDRRRQFTQSRAMCWVAFDRAVKMHEFLGRPDLVSRWAELRDRIRDAIIEHGFDRRRNHFKRAFDDDGLDSSVLMLPLMHFLPFDDPRMVGTVRAIERELADSGFVRRYHHTEDGLDSTECAFLPC